MNSTFNSYFEENLRSKQDSFILNSFYLNVCNFIYCYRMSSLPVRSCNSFGVGLVYHSMQIDRLVPCGPSSSFIVSLFSPPLSLHLSKCMLAYMCVLVVSLALTL